jgi:hypothetical protein
MVQTSSQQIPAIPQNSRILRIHVSMVSTILETQSKDHILVVDNRQNLYVMSGFQYGSSWCIATARVLLLIVSFEIPGHAGLKSMLDCQPASGSATACGAPLSAACRKLVGDWIRWQIFAWMVTLYPVNLLTCLQWAEK